MIVPPVSTGRTGILMRAVENARVSSNRPIARAITTTGMNASFWMNSVAMTTPISPTPTAIDAGRLRPARLVFSATAGVSADSGVSAGDSDVKELCLFVLEQLVDRVDVLLGHRVEPLL